MKTKRILVVDDDSEYLELLSDLLNSEGYTELICESNPLKVSSILGRTAIDLVLLDIFMPQMNGLDLLEIIARDNPSIKVIVITAVDTTEIALKAIKLGAYDFITKPLDTDRLFITIQKAFEQQLLEEERDSLRGTKLQVSKKKNFANIITGSPVMDKVFDLVEIFAPTNETVLIEGETGTGKDLIAFKIHELSLRSNENFITVNLASISSSLFESELFGHEKGAFTGAVSEKKGFFEEANGGTIFLDEIGELPKELQGKLLRTIQYGEIYRIGSSKPVKLDIRIIAATNKNLLQSVNSKEFRPDLYYRLNRGYINLPPLRMRGDDVFILADHFRKVGNKLYEKEVSGFSDNARHSLKNHTFPGNIRELENMVLNAVAKTSDGGVIDSLSFPEYDRPFKPSSINSNSDFKPLEYIVDEYIERVLDYTGRNIRNASIILGISERTIQRKLKEKKNKTGNNLS